MTAIHKIQINPSIVLLLDSIFSRFLYDFSNFSYNISGKY